MKKEPDFKVNIDNIIDNNDAPKMDFTNSFTDKLIEVFKSGAGDLLEVKRLVNSQHLAKDLDLLLNDEEHSLAYTRMRLIDNADVSASDFMKHYE